MKSILTKLIHPDQLADSWQAARLFPAELRGMLGISNDLRPRGTLKMPGNDKITGDRLSD